MVKIIGNVIGIGCRSKITSVTTVTLCGSSRIPGAVTGDTSQRLMCTGQCKLRLIVIKGCRCPGNIGVASQAIMVKIARFMVRVVSLSKIPGMTRVTER